MEELGRKQERSPARRSGRRDVPKNEETPAPPAAPEAPPEEIMLLREIRDNLKR